MDIESNRNEMPLNLVITQWLAENEWKDKIEVDLEDLTSRVTTTIGVNNQGYRLFVDALEK
jgi:hypothetical protein